jgi:TolB-like protein
MTKTEFQIIEMLGRIVAFGQAYEDKFPKKSLAGDTLAAIEAAIGKTYELAAVQDQRGMRLRTDERKTARDTLTAQLEAIRETSLGVSIDHPATDLRLPSDQVRLEMLRAVICILVFLHTAAAAERIKRIAILDFENASPGRKFDSFRLGLAETMHQELKRVPTLMLVDRSNLDKILKEFRIGQSALIKPGTAPKMGKLLGADSFLAGTYQIIGNDVRLGAHIIDVETSTVRVAVEVNGPLRDFLKLESDLAKQLIAGIQGAPLNLEPLPDRNFDAFQMFSDGVYFLRNDHLKDALTKFDRALALDPAYVDAQFYRGLTLKKLQRWDEAISSFPSWNRRGGCAIKKIWRSHLKKRRRGGQS